MKRMKPALGIAIKRSFALCRMVNVDPASPRRYSSLNVVVDELNGWTWEIALDFVDGRLHVVIPQSCRRRPTGMEYVQEVLSELMELSPEKMFLLCAERLDTVRLLEMLLTEIDLYNPDKMAWVDGLVREELGKCILEPNP